MIFKKKMMIVKYIQIIMIKSIKKINEIFIPEKYINSYQQVYIKNMKIILIIKFLKIENLIIMKIILSQII